MGSGGDEDLEGLAVCHGLVAAGHAVQPDRAVEDPPGLDAARQQRWAQHDVRRHRAGARRLNHPLIGALTVNYETMELAADQGLYLIVGGVAPGSRDADALSLLASWTAAPENTQDTTLNRA